MHSIGEGFDRAERAGTGRVVHSASALSVLLVVEVQSSRIRHSKLGKGSTVGKDVAVFEEPNVFPSELDGSGA
jgi:hypothetical protein